MFRNILGTAASRMFNAVLSLVILVINTNNLGQVGLGTITLVVLGITVLLMISNFIGGGALVYLVPRHDLYKLFVPSYIWALITSVFGAIILQIFNLIPAEYTWYILVMSLFQSFAMINLTILIGKEKISLYNTLTVIQQVVTTLVLILLIYVWHRVEVIAYVYALFSGYVLVFLLSLAAIRKYVTVTSLSGVRYVIGELFKYGKFLQIANIIQFFNYRLSYYIIEAFSGRAALGLYGAGVQISEGVWLIGKSVATVQYARISNVNDMIYARNVTLRLLKFTFLLTAIVLAGLLALPERLYGAIFGQDFENIRLIMLTLALGILATAVSMLVSHFFSGTGKPQHNMIGSAIGLVFTLVLGLVFIPRYGLIAAGLTASVSYIMNMAYLLIVFIRRSGAEIKDFLISREDYLFVRSEVKKIMERNS